ncbi:hypothetical protein BKA69DRAFT_1047817 [Paraphysoderma sedebokerense]|nr:hypothetical protein BKA69DRAFT_1047759 [Paraphysoderma sedebokerense]KAI9145474.1 hypothetical protein BKA69DRAFT_1047817 [Paraphysoderma sedebokerense]
MNEPPNEQLRQLESMQNENAHGPPPNGPPLPNGIPGPISPTSPTPGQFYEGPGMPPFRSQSDLHTQHTSASDLISLPSPSNVPQGWFDKLIDKLLGDDGSEENQKYALICSQCHRHNGLVRPDDIEDTRMLSVSLLNVRSFVF